MKTPSRRTLGQLLAVAGTVALTASLAGCGGNSASASDGPIVLGATLSLTGSLGSIGPVEKEGYEQFVKDVNAAGGIDVGGTKRKVEVKYLDNRSDPTLASQQASELVLKDGAAALLGACTPPITVPVGLVAEKNRVPYVTSCTPVQAFAAANKAGWQYSWDFFFNEDDQAKIAFEGAATISSNKKAAIFTDNEPDGTVERELFKKEAAAAGFDVVGDYTFPVGTSDFTSFINEAKAKQAQVVVAQMTPPDGIALVKQMKSLGLKPAYIAVEKAGDTATWVPSLGKLADGTVHQWFWSPATKRPGTDQIMAGLGKKMDGNVSDIGIALACYDVATVVTDAMTKAGTTDPDKVNAAIGETDKAYTFADIKFGEDHTASTPVVLAQWQADGQSVQVYPKAGAGTLKAPTAGLQ